MKLADYIHQRGLTLEEFGQRILCSKMAVSRYARGLRMPKPGVMRRIVDATGGLVTPNDFYLGGETFPESQGEAA